MLQSIDSLKKRKNVCKQKANRIKKEDYFPSFGFDLQGPLRVFSGWKGKAADAIGTIRHEIHYTLQEGIHEAAYT